MEEYSVDDPTQLLEAASDFASYPGFQNDASAKEFLDRFPLPVILNALQTKADVPGLESTLVAVLERVFKTKYGASLIPQFMPFVQVGLTAESQEVKSLACKTVSCLLENLNEGSVSATRLILDHNIYPLLLDCLIHGNEKVATLAMDAIAKIAGSPEGIDIVFPANNKEATHLGALADQCSSVGRVRVLALIVKLFSISANVASVVQKSNLLGLFEAEINNTNDTLSTLSILELLYELTEIEHGGEFLSASTLLQLLSSIISNKSMESILRTRAMMISGRILSKENYIPADELNLKTVLSAIDRILSSSETQEIDECESALEALGQIGSSTQGAQRLLSSSPPVARHVIYAAFDRHGRGKQLAALHALGNISGETRSANSMILTSDAEESLRRLIYETASKSSKLTPSGLFLSVLKQDSEIRLAGYRMMSGLVARPWCLMEICSKQEIINIVTDPITETTKLDLKTVLSAIDRVLSSSETQEIDECESALEALGQIGSSTQGAQRLLSSSPPVARHVIYEAFDRHGRGKQLAALHALGNISGETRSANSMILTSDAEESLRRLIYETASKSSKLTPSGLFLSVLKQDSEIRLAGYRMMSGLVARPWCLMEICSKQEIINIVTDPITETTKLAMEARYNCCKAIHTAFNMSSKLASDQSLSGIAAKLHDSVKMGPYLARKHLEAQPMVVTEDRF